MSEETGPVCPECGTPKAADGAPACTCARRASDAHRDTRAAQAAAAEDFDPLRIRPFVKVGDGTSPEAAVLADTDPPTVPLELDRPVPGPVDEEPAPDGGEGGRRPRRGVWLAGAAVGAAVLVTGGLVGGLLSYRSPSRDGSVPEDVRAGLPADASRDGTPSAAPSPATSSPRPSVTATPSPSASPAATASPGSPAPTVSSSATATAAPAPSGSADQNPVLRLGDTGPQVTELQLRLHQIGFYDGDADGDYDGDVESAVRSYQFTRVILADESGVYGHATRASLESETARP